MFIPGRLMIYYEESEVTVLGKAGYFYVHKHNEWCRDTDCYSTVCKNADGTWELYYNKGFDPDEGHDDEHWETLDSLKDVLDFL